MKTVMKYAAVALAGYFVGFYEMKYKTLKMFLEHELEKKGESE